jgi:hypothetical protein
VEEPATEAVAAESRFTTSLLLFAIVAYTERSAIAGDTKMAKRDVRFGWRTV